MIDPRTGEIIKGHVSLGSLRVRQDYLIAEGLLAPYERGKAIPAEQNKAQQMALRAHRALGCEGMSRVDMFAHEGEIMLLEVNTIPGLTPGSLLPKAAAAAGIDFPELVNRIIQGALRRERRRRGRERKPV